MSLVFRLAVFVPVLYLIAIVVAGQHHATAKDVIQAATKRTVRWIVWTGVLLAVMIAADALIIGW